MSGTLSAPNGSGPLIFYSEKVAESLSESPKTIENHRSRMMNKLGIHSSLRGPAMLQGSP